MYTLSLYLFIIIFFSSIFVHSTVFDGKVHKTKDGFKILGAFAFENANDIQTEAGKIQITLKSPKASTLDVIIYSDQESSWKKIFNDRTGKYKSDLSCYDKITYAKNYNYKTDKIIDFNNQKTHANFGSVGTFSSEYNIYQQSRPRFWYLGIVNCDDITAIENIEYNVEFVNLLVSYPNWEQQFGANENGIQSLYLIYYFLYTIYIFIHFKGIKKLKESLSYIHPLIKMFTAAIIIEYISLTSYLIYYGSYAQNGIGNSLLYFVGDLFNCISTLMFVVLLVIISKGWTISNEILDDKKTIQIVFIVMLLIRIILLAWEAIISKPEIISVPIILSIFQYLVITFYASFGILYAKTIAKSYEDEDNIPKKFFYKNIGITYSIWIFMIPLITYLKIILDPWTEEVWTTALSLSNTCLGYFIFTYITWPTRASQYFTINTPSVHLGKSENTGAGLDYSELI